MKYILDSVVKEDMEKWFPYVKGVTSNPILLNRAKIDIEQFLKNVISTPNGMNMKVFVQVYNMKDVKIVKNLWKQIMNIPQENMRGIKTSSSNNLVFKVTMHPKMYSFIEELKQNNYNVAATTMYDIIQINQAIGFECDYTMVYKHKNENPNLFEQAYKLKQLTQSNIKLVGASFRGKQEICEAMLFGMDYITATSQTLEETFKNAQLEADFNELYA